MMISSRALHSKRVQITLIISQEQLKVKLLNNVLPTTIHLPEYVHIHCKPDPNEMGQIKFW